MPLVPSRLENGREGKFLLGDVIPFVNDLEERLDALFTAVDSLKARASSLEQTGKIASVIEPPPATVTRTTTRKKKAGGK